MSNLSTAIMVANEIVKEADFAYANDRSIVNILLALQSILSGGNVDYIIGGKVQPYVSGGMNFVIEPVMGHSHNSEVDVIETEKTAAISVEAASSTLDRLDIVQIRGITLPFDPQQRTFRDSETGAESVNTINTKKRVALDVVVKKGLAGSLAAPQADIGFIKIAELVIPAGTVNISVNNIKNITASIAGSENNLWTVDKSRTFNPWYLSDIIARFLHIHDETGNLKDAMIKASNINFGIENGEVNGRIISIGNSLNILEENYTSQTKIADIAKALANAINTVYPYANSIFSRFSYTTDLPVAASIANINITSGGEMAIDGIVCKVGDMVFLKDQTDKSQNGYWEVQTGTWIRSTGYANSNLGCFDKKFILVKRGTENAGRVYYLAKDVTEVGHADLEFLESIFSPKKIPGKVLIRDQNGDADGLGVVASDGGLGMVAGETETEDGSTDGMINVLTDGRMKLIGFERLERRIIGKVDHFDVELSEWEMAVSRLLPLEYQLIEIALYQELCDKEWKKVGPELNNTAPFWYKCDHLGNRTVSGQFMRVEDSRGLFPRNAGQNAVFKGANNTPYNGGEVGEFQPDQNLAHTHSVRGIVDNLLAYGTSIISLPSGTFVSTGSSGGSEAKPASISRLEYISY
jgi:hypothetical protein